MAPSCTRRVLLAVSFPTLRRSAWTIANPFRPRSGAGRRCLHRRHSGETSQLGGPALAGALIPNPVRMPLRLVASDPLPQGRHRTFRSRSLALRHGSCLLSLKLRFPSQADDPVFGASRSSDLIASPRSCRPPGTFHQLAQSAMIRSLFTFRLRHRIDLAALCSSSLTAG